MSGEPFNPEMLVLARMSRGWTQAQVAGKAKLSQGYMSKMEHGFLTPDDGTVKRLAKILDYPPAFFYQIGYIVPLPIWFHMCGGGVGPR